MFRIHGLPSLVPCPLRPRFCVPFRNFTSALVRNQPPTAESASQRRAVSTTQRPPASRRESDQHRAQRRAHSPSAACNASPDWPSAPCTSIANTCRPPMAARPRMPGQQLLNDRPSVSPRRITGLISLKREQSTRPSKHHYRRPPPNNWTGTAFMGSRFSARSQGALATQLPRRSKLRFSPANSPKASFARALRCQGNTTTAATTRAASFSCLGCLTCALPAA